MPEEDRVTFARPVEAIQVPSGDRITLEAGTEGRIIQALGGTYSVVTDNGYMVRVAGKDGDAIGQPIVEDAAASVVPETREQVEEAVWDQLRTCYDPEIPFNIADLGLIYSCAVSDLEDGGRRVKIEMTLTAPGCGMGDVLKAEVEDKVHTIPTVTETDVEVVFEPPWDFNMIPDATKLTMGMM